MHQVEVKGILSAKNGMNIYRGCSHGCIYCDSRSRCYQMQHAFEDIEVKANAPQLLEEALRRKRKKCMIGTGAMSDPYMPLEMELGLMRRCLELIQHYGFGAAVLTKSTRILRDIELLKKINEKTKCVVQTTLTTYDEELCKVIEPNVSTTRERFEMLMTLKEHGIPTVVWISPILPYINDSEENLRGLLSYCTDAQIQGILCFGMGLTLRDGNREYYYQQLDSHFPGLKERYMREYGNAYELPCKNSRRLLEILKNTCKEAGIMCNVNQVFQYLAEFEDKETKNQLSFL